MDEGMTESAATQQSDLASDRSSPGEEESNEEDVSNTEEDSNEEEEASEEEASEEEASEEEASEEEASEEEAADEEEVSDEEEECNEEDGTNDQEESIEEEEPNEEENEDLVAADEIIEVDSESDSEQEDEPGDIQEHLKSRLEHHLDQLRETSTGEFSTSGLMSNTPNPGLQVPGLGTIGMPLSITDAERIKEVCHQAPFGQGTRTMVNESVRKTWELNPTQFALSNPRWQDAIEQVKLEALAGLGLAGKAARAELYKMLLYEQGAFFKKHRDSEKAPGMFATLVICLSSKHEGGNVITTFERDTRILNTSGTSEFEISYLAWYADVEHEVKPVISGHRLVLTYNIISEGDASTALPCAAGLEGTERSIRKLLRQWSRWTTSARQKVPLWLAYRLRHKYTNANLNQQQMKGHDRVVVALLASLQQSARFKVLLGNYEKMQSGSVAYEDYGGYNRYGRYNRYPEHDYSRFHKLYELADQSFKMLIVSKLSGRLVSEDVAWSEEMFLSEQDTRKTKPDHEDFTGYTGNEGCEATHFYRSSCIIIVPRTASYCFRASYDDDHKFRYLDPERLLRQPAQSLKRQQEVKHLQDNFSAARHAPLIGRRSNLGPKLLRMQGKIATMLLKVAVKSADKQTFDNILAELKVATGVYSVAEHRQLMMNGIGSMGLRDNTAVLDVLLDNLPGGTSDLPGQTEAVLKVCNYMLRLGPELEEHDVVEVWKWKRKRLWELTQDLSLIVQDTEDVSELVEHIGFDQFLLKLRKPGVSENLIGFLMQFTVRLQSSQEQDWRIQCAKLIAIVDSYSQITALFDFEARSESGYQPYSKISSESLARYLFVKAIVKRDRFERSNRNLLQIVAAARQINPAAFPLLFLGLISDLHLANEEMGAEVIASSARNGNATNTKNEIQAALEKYAQSIVKVFVERSSLPKPFKVSTWERSTLAYPCCIECLSINSFLCDAREERNMIPIPHDKIDHIVKRLNSAKDVTHEARPHPRPSTYNLFIRKTTGKYEQNHLAFMARLTDIAETLKEHLTLEAVRSYFPCILAQQILHMPEMMAVWNPTPEQATQRLASGSATKEQRDALTQIVYASRRAERRAMSSSATPAAVPEDSSARSTPAIAGSKRSAPTASGSGTSSSNKRRNLGT